MHIKGLASSCLGPPCCLVNGKFILPQSLPQTCSHSQLHMFAPVHTCFVCHPCSFRLLSYFSHVCTDSYTSSHTFLLIHSFSTRWQARVLPSWNLESNPHIYSCSLSFTQMLEYIYIYTHLLSLFVALVFDISLPALYAEKQSGEVTHPQAHSQKAKKSEFKPRSPG